MKDLIVVTTSALPDSARVLGFWGSESLSRPYQLEVFVALDDSHDAPEPAEGLGAPIRLGFRHEPTDPPFHFHGVISEISLVQQIAGDSGAGRAVFRLTIVPQLWMLGQSQHSRIFTKKSIPEILSKVLLDAGIASDDFEFRLSGAYPIEEHVCQYRESDLAFITRWMEHEGLYYFFEHGEDAEKLVIVDDIASHTALAQGPVPYHAATDDESAKQCIQSAALSKRTLPARVVVQDYDYQKPALDLIGRADVSAAGLAHISVYGDRVFSPADAVRSARLRAEALAARGTRLNARGTQRLLRAGYLFTLGDHPRAEFNRSWLVTEVTHTARQTMGAAELDARIQSANPEVYQVGVVGQPSDLPYRELRETPWPRIHGFENGIVDGAAASTYAQIDDAGRYAIKLYFDEGEGKNGSASTFVRMAQPHGGGIEGLHFPLRKGTEVLVQFQDGDPDRPLIAAVLPNAATPSPVTGKNNTKNVLQTGGTTRMEIEDLAGGQYMHTTTPPKNTGMWMGTDSSSKGGHNVELSTDGSGGKSFGAYFDRFIGATKSEHTVGDVMRSYDANFNSTVSSNVEQNYQANQSQTVKSNVLRAVVGTLTDAVVGAVEQKLSATWTVQVADDVGQTFQAMHGSLVKGTQDVHVLAKGDGTHEQGLAQTVNGALSKHVATSGYKLEATTDYTAHVAANLSIRGDVNAVFSAPATTVDGDTSVLMDAGSTIDAKAIEIAKTGTALVKLAGPLIEILGGEVFVEGGNISLTASSNLVAGADGAVALATPGVVAIQGGPSVLVNAGVITLNVTGGGASGLGLAIDALLALDVPAATRLAELMKAGWVIQYGEPGSGSYVDRAKKIIVLDPSLQADPEAATNTLGRLTERAQNPQTPVYGQEEPMSCGMGASRMMIDSQTGENVPESVLRAESAARPPDGYDPVNGTNMSDLPTVLRDHGVANASDVQQMSVDDLASATAHGDPAMVHLAHQGGGGHFVVVDGVTENADGTRTVFGRDPDPVGTGSTWSMPESQFNSDFWGNGGNSAYSGWAISTDPPP